MLNPYAPPNSLRGDIESFAARYRVDVSKTTLAEFRNLSGKPIIGTLVWMAMQAGLVRLDKQIVDGPRSFADEECTLDELRDPVRSHLLTVADSAEQLGFHTGYTYDHLSWRSFRDGPWFGAVPTLTAAAGVTDHLRLGTLVTSVKAFSPIAL